MVNALRRNLCVVCHQLRSPDNLGAIARVMANFGFDRLILSDPLTYAFRDAEKLSVRAQSVLESMQVATGLKEALSGCVYAVGTTSRKELKRLGTISPEEGTRRLAEASARGKVALVLGGEKRGLSDDELSLCQDAIVIPTEPVQPSMNVAQAAAVLLYLCARQVVPPKEVPQLEGAPLSLLFALEERLLDVLSRAEFLNPQAPHHALRELWRTLARAGLSRREAEMWLSALEHVRRHLGP